MWCKSFVRHAVFYISGLKMNEMLGKFYVTPAAGLRLIFLRIVANTGGIVLDSQPEHSWSITAATTRTKCGADLFGPTVGQILRQIEK
jgi:hypothetical protein